MTNDRMAPENDDAHEMKNSSRAAVPILAGRPTRAGAHTKKEKLSSANCWKILEKVLIVGHARPYRKAYTAGTLFQCMHHSRLEKFTIQVAPSTRARRVLAGRAPSRRAQSRSSPASAAATSRYSACSPCVRRHLPGACSDRGRPHRCPPRSAPQHVRPALERHDLQAQLDAPAARGEGGPGLLARQLLQRARAHHRREGRRAELRGEGLGEVHLGAKRASVQQTTQLRGNRTKHETPAVI